MRDSGSLEKVKKPRRLMLPFVYLWMLIILFQLPCNAANLENKSDVSNKELASNAEKKWGILPLSIQLTAAGQLLDYRYLVIDPVKAAALMKRNDKAYLIGQESGIKIPVSGTKVGPLGQTGTKPIAGKVYPILFVNTAGVIKAGSKVTLVIGEFRMENIVVGKAVAHKSKLTQTKRAKWDVMQKMIRKERGTCIEGCQQNRNCIDKCEKAYKNRLNKEYQKLINEK